MLSVKAMGLKVIPLLTLAVRNGADASALPFKNQQTPPSLWARAAFAGYVRVRCHRQRLV
jgi:hypothetical protein